MSEKRQWVKLEADCGAPIFVWHIPDGVSIALGAMVRVGSCDETWPQEAGIAHAYEHMFFQGTERFKNSKQMTKYIELCGGYQNANTWYERTFYYSKVPIDFVERGLVFLSEGLLRPNFDPEKIKVEMKNIVQELKMYKNDPERYADQIFTSVIYGGHPFAKDIIGTEESVSAFRQEDFLKWKNRFYYPENFVFVCAGGIDPQRVKDLIDKFFKPSSSCRRISHIRNISVDLVGQTPRFIFVPKNDWQQTQVFMGAATTEGDSSEVLALDFFTDMLSGMSGPLFQEVRDKRGLAYHVSAGISPLKLLSNLQIYVGTDPKKWENVIKIVKMVIEKSKNSKRLFGQTKMRLLGSMAVVFDEAGPDRRISSAVNSIILRGQPRTFEDIKKEIESITLDQVEAAVDKYLNPDRLTVVVVGPEIK
jgi:predicted Zn-dependent peptidase